MPALRWGMADHDAGPRMPRSSLGMTCGRGAASRRQKVRCGARSSSSISAMGPTTSIGFWPEPRTRGAARLMVGFAAWSPVREELRLLVTIDQAADIRPVERAGAHGTGLADRDHACRSQEVGRIGLPQRARQLGLGVTNSIEVALPHEDAVVGPDQHRAEGMVPMHRRLARDFIGGAKVGKHRSRVMVGRAPERRGRHREQLA